MGLLPPPSSTTDAPVHLLPIQIVPPLQSSFLAWKQLKFMKATSFRVQGLTKLMKMLWEHARGAMMVLKAHVSASIERSIRPLRYLDADALCRINDLGEEVTARLREEWGKLGEFRGSFPDCYGLSL
jgi:hypothetical protein